MCPRQLESVVTEQQCVLVVSCWYSDNQPVQMCQVQQLSKKEKVTCASAVYVVPTVTLTVRHFYILPFAPPGSDLFVMPKFTLYDISAQAATPTWIPTTCHSHSKDYQTLPLQPRSLLPHEPWLFATPTSKTIWHSHNNPGCYSHMNLTCHSHMVKQQQNSQNLRCETGFGDEYFCVHGTLHRVRLLGWSGRGWGIFQMLKLGCL